MYRQLCLIIILSIVCILTFYYANDSSIINSTYTELVSRIKTKRNVVILAGTTYFGRNITTMEKRFVKACSPEIQSYCRVTSDLNETDIADAIVYHNRDFNGTMVNSSTAFHVMFTAESPVHERIRFKPDTINWTMSFRRDSNIYAPYGSMFKTRSQKPIDLEEIWEEKEDNVTASWMASNCRTNNNRTELIKRAKKEGLQVDIYGGCGKKLPNCGRYHSDHYNCAALTLSKYKFYLSFENSICLDYVTEKFWYAMKIYKAVPIVIQRKIVQNLGVPGDTFIALDDFKTIKDMVTFLNDLAEDKERYLMYHRWRNEFSVEVEEDDGFCELCRRLSEDRIAVHVYRDLADWFSSKTCDNTYAFRYLK